MADITGSTSVFPGGVDKFPKVDPYLGATPGNWGDMIVPQYVNHIADGIFNLQEQVHRTTQVQVQTPVLLNDGASVTSATGSLFVARFCVEFTDLYLLSVLYNPDVSEDNTYYLFSTFQEVPVPADVLAELGSLSIENSIVNVRADARPKAPLHSRWTDARTRMFPYAAFIDGKLYFRMYTPTPMVHDNLGGAYVSFEIAVVK